MPSPAECGLSLLSPLRYPGAKRRLSGYLAHTLRLNGLRPRLFVEPFAGGASVSLYLMRNDLVERVGLGEKDPLVAAFWQTLFWDTEWLTAQVEQIPIDLDTWDHYRNAALRSRRDKALACLFLNRTSFSGILASSAGPLGGRAQCSEYKIDCRFNRHTVIRRILEVARFRERVAFVDNADWAETLVKTLSSVASPADAFVYLDPPFYNKADRLYRFHFTHDDHVALRNQLVGLAAKWLLSYDPASEIIQLYSGNGLRPGRVRLLYSAAASNELVDAEELIISNLPRLPKRTRLWSSRLR